MSHTSRYHISGATCQSCISKIDKTLRTTDGVTDLSITGEPATAQVHITSSIPLSVTSLQTALTRAYKSAYTLHEHAVQSQSPGPTVYAPVIILLTLIYTVSLLVSIGDRGVIDWHMWMRVSMAGFFLSFSYFKLIDVRAFRAAFAMYDPLASKISVWGYMYPFVELGLGISYALDIYPRLAALITIIILGSTTLGIIPYLRTGRRIPCACLGAVFELPMSTVTLIENSLMITMALVTLIL